MSDMDRVYCTYFDSGYAARASVMVESLRRVGESGTVYALCFDEEAYAAVTRRWTHDDVVPIRIADLEESVPALAQVRPERSRVEFYFTCTPLVVQFALARSPGARWVTYLDADLCFFNRVETIYEWLGQGSAAIIPHDYGPRHQRFLRYGTYNVGWVTFARTPEGTRLLDRWAQQCLEWCHDTPSEGRFADQGYLDEFPAHAPNLCVVEDPGSNLAPWNLGHRRVSRADDGIVLVDDRPLRFFHFHGLHRRGERYVASHAEYGARANDTVRRFVYQPYIDALAAAEAQMQPALPPARRGRGLRGWALRMRRMGLDQLARTRGESFVAGDRTRVEGGRQQG